MDQPTTPPPADATDPLAVASVVLALVGVVVYCCGGLVCLGWIAPIVWLAGAILGGIAIAKNTGTNRTIGIAGVAANVLLGLAMGAVMVLSMLGFVLMEGANSY